MRVKVNLGSAPGEGDIRFKRGFLWLPKKIENEWRWLELVVWTQERARVTVLVPEGGHSLGQTRLVWVDREWGADHHLAATAIASDRQLYDHRI